MAMLYNGIWKIMGKIPLGYWKYDPYPIMSHSHIPFIFLMSHWGVGNRSHRDLGNMSGIWEWDILGYRKELGTVQRVVIAFIVALCCSVTECNSHIPFIQRRPIISHSSPFYPIISHYLPLSPIISHYIPSYPLPISHSSNEDSF